MIFLLRHGQTEFNSQDRVQGRIDSPLTALGVAQARAMGERLKAIADSEGGRWEIETSPLGRARQTAGIVAEAMGLPAPTIDARLAEVSYGDLEGLTVSEARAHAPQFATGDSIFGRAPGGETYAALAARVADWLSDHPEDAGRHLVAVSHAGTSRMARGLYLGLDEPAIRALDKPQGVVFRLHGGRIERFECAPVAAP
ncbi:MAG: histidine phosphatase family protein [Caulobacteraceae bacterium]